MIAVVHFKSMFSNRDAALGIWIAYVGVAGITLIILEVLSVKSKTFSFPNNSLLQTGGQ